MKEGWAYKKLGDACIVERGSSPRPIKDFITGSEDGVNWVKIGDTNKNEKYVTSTKQKITKKGAEKSRFVEVGDFILSNSMSFGRPYIMKVPGYIHDGWFVLRLPKDINSDYFWYLLSSPLLIEQFKKLAAGAIVKNISGDLVKKAELPIPPIKEQKQIVAILDKAFAAIDQAKANIEKNIENAKELIENFTYQLFVNSNWNQIEWGEVCDFIRGPFGGSLKKSIFVESGYAVYEQKQAIHNDFKSLRYFISEERFQEMRRFEVQPKDLLMSCSGVTLGRISEVPENAPKGIINQALLKLRTKPNYILNEFLMIWIRSKIFQDLIFEFAGGAAQPNVPGVKVLKTISVPCPSIKEQQDFIDLYNKMRKSINESIKSYSNKIENLDEFKKSILQKAFAGELTH